MFEFTNETAEERALRYSSWASIVVAVAVGTIATMELSRWKPQATKFLPLGGGLVLGAGAGILATQLLKPQLFVDLPAPQALDTEVSGLFGR
jgi:hypothetical protein